MFLLPEPADATEDILARCAEARAIQQDYKARTDALVKESRDAMQRAGIQIWLCRRACRDSWARFQATDPHRAAHLSALFQD